MNKMIKVIEAIEKKLNIRSNREKIEYNLVKLFHNKLNIKDNKDKTAINTNQTMNAYSKTKVSKNNKYKGEENSNDVNIYEKINKIISSMDNNKIKYSGIHTETSFKKRTLLFNSNSQSSEKSSTSRKNNFNNNNYALYVKKVNKMNISMDNNKIILKNDKPKNSLNNFNAVEIFEKNKKIITMENRKNEEEKTIMNKENNYKEYNIITLDINGTVYLYYNKIQRALFNIYEIKNIKQKYKNLKFFDMGFPYYIIANEKYICITTDSGLFVFSK